MTAAEGDEPDQREGGTMTDRGVFTVTGASIEEAAVEQFKASLRGQLLRPGDDAYDEARKLWNGIPVRARHRLAMA